jgi:hypothetical protein
MFATILALAMQPSAGDFKMPIVLGTRWVYIDQEDEEVTFEITKSVQEKTGETTIELSRVNEAGKRHCETLRVSKNGIFRTHVENRQLVVPLCILKLPSKNDAKWELLNKAGNLERKGVARLESAKEVKVPAGKYQAVQVTMDFLVNEDKDSISCWYGSGVGLVKMVDNSGSKLELKSFTLGSKP